MERIKIAEETNFIGCWNLNDDNLCNNIINLFEQNKQFHQRGATGSGINENIKKSIDMVVHPKNINTKEFELFKVYLNKLFDCYQDYKKIWPFIDQRIPKVDIPSFNVQKYEKSEFSLNTPRSLLSSSSMGTWVKLFSCIAVVASIMRDPMVIEKICLNGTQISAAFLGFKQNEMKFF